MNALFLSTLCLLLLNGATLYAQTDCSCVRNFDAVVEKIELNYAGFVDKTKGTQSAAYQRMRDSLRTAAEHTTQDNCFDVLAAYTLFFRDRHVQLGNYEVAKLPKTFEPLTLAQARQQTKNARADDLPGIWHRDDGKLQVAILHQPGSGKDGYDYRGIVLSSRDTTMRPGLELFRAKRRGQSYYVKAILNGLYNHQFPTKQHGNIFYATWNMTLVREFPFTPTPTDQLELAANRINNGLYVRSLAKDVALISLRRGFTLSSNVMDSVLRAHEPLLSQTPNLIIDLRDNGGGNNTWENLLPYIYSKPVVWPGGWLIRSSPDNIQALEADTAGSSPKQRAKDQTFIDKLKQNRGQLVNTGGESITIQLERVRPNPRRVVLLVNEGCGSSTEFLTQIAKQSPGVTVMGSPTAGVMDYGDLRRAAKLPCPDLHLMIAMAKSPWTDTTPIDPTGIVPHINLAHLPESQWLSIAVKKLQSNTLAAKP
ncbi:S41 family peptidase [Spirosoma utsteinense]|uniref:S41 family peptidase n=1 Tax=Spirosoma utsteinense TaxID=2585773 RepID=UPI0016462BD8|nr:S41 family peptidase [Spirosoma utsteinense]MBC3789084.1 hypothetical protein [Spirosoma utsteinense]